MEFILPDDNNLSSKERGEIQNSILLQVYDETYPVANIDKAIEQVSKGMQKILFWGDDLEKIKKFQAGTMALVFDTSKGDSCVEMCRAGSTIENGGGIKAVRELYNYFLQNSEINQLFATPRNCLERTNDNGEKIPAGKTISKIYSRLKDMQYWGIAPWYIMPGNTIELLDLRIHTKNDKVKERIFSGEKLYLYNEDDISLFNYIIENNYQVSDSIGKGEIIEELQNIKFDFTYDNNDKTRKYTYSILSDNNNGEFNIEYVEKILLEEINSGVNLVKLNLFDEKNIIVQKFLEEKGYKLVSLFPEENKMMGYWFKSKNTNYALPYYFVEEQNKKDINLELQKNIIEKIVLK